MSVQTAFQGEVQFRRYSDTSTQGQQVVFAVADREALESFIGKEGKRFMAVLVEIGDDEQPVQAEQKTAGQPENCRSSEKQQVSRERLGDLAWRAVQWCKEPEFADFITAKFYDLHPSGLPGTPVVNPNGSSEEFCKFAVQALCGIESRKELDANEDAKRLFNQLIRGPYQKHLMARGIK